MTVRVTGASDDALAVAAAAALCCSPKSPAVADVLPADCAPALAGVPPGRGPDASAAGAAVERILAFAGLRLGRGYQVDSDARLPYAKWSPNALRKITKRPSLWLWPIAMTVPSWLATTAAFEAAKMSTAGVWRAGEAVAAPIVLGEGAVALAPIPAVAPTAALWPGDAEAGR